MEKLMISEILDTKACEKEFGVSAAITQIVPKDPKPPKKKTEFDVELTNFGSQKVKVIKAIREITGLGLREAKEFVEAAPKIIKDGVSIEEAYRRSGKSGRRYSYAFYEYQDIHYNY